MKMRLISLVGMLMASTAVAQEQPNSAEYHARHNPASPYYTGGGQQAKAPKVRWADRWGAIASDDAGIYGIISDSTSKRKAQKTALEECKKRGGGACAVTTTYVNQCVAVVSSKAWTHEANAPTTDEAIATATKGCTEHGGKDCHVYYSGCSLPVQVN